MDNDELIKEIESIKYEIWNVEKLIPYARNPRKNNHVVDKMASQIKEFGMPIPICIMPDGSIVDGHLRYKACKKLNLTKIPVAINETWSEQKIKAFRLSVNKSASWAEWDMEFLKLEISELENIDYDLLKTGFDYKEINEILENLSFSSDSDEGGKDGNGEFEDEENSHVKMIQLFYDEDTEKNFRSFVKFIQTRFHFGNESISDTVYNALKHLSEKLEKEIVSDKSN
jgi:hypothetical protein